MWSDKEAGWPMHPYNSHGMLTPKGRPPRAYARPAPPLRFYSTCYSPHVKTTEMSTITAYAKPLRTFLHVPSFSSPHVKATKMSRAGYADPLQTFFVPPFLFVLRNRRHDVSPLFCSYSE